MLQIDSELNNFLEKWDHDYTNSVSQLAIFNKEKTSALSKPQCQYFVKLFYHIRGHFHELLWFLGNFAPDKENKDLILKNIVDELGERGLSHEKLYHLFAEQVGVELTQEMIEGETYLPFIQEFNKGYIRWLHQHDWSTRLSAFAALERLDNIDYANAKGIAESMGVNDRGLAFFNVHMNSKHFDGLTDALFSIWEQTPEKVKLAFDFVANHQFNALNKLSDEIFTHQKI